MGLFVAVLVGAGVGFPLGEIVGTSEGPGVGDPFVYVGAPVEGAAVGEEEGLGVGAPGK